MAGRAAFTIRDNAMSEGASGVEKERLTSDDEPARLVPLVAGAWGWRRGGGVGQTGSCVVRWRAQARHQAAQS